MLLCCVFAGVRQVGRFTVYGTGQRADETVAGKKVRGFAVESTGEGGGGTFPGLMSVPWCFLNSIDSANWLTI